jgi:hypothetical protein
VSQSDYLRLGGYKSSKAIEPRICHLYTRTSIARSRSAGASATAAFRIRNDGLLICHYCDHSDYYSLSPSQTVCDCIVAEKQELSKFYSLSRHPRNTLMARHPRNTLARIPRGKTLTEIAIVDFSSASAMRSFATITCV